MSVGDRDSTYAAVADGVAALSELVLGALARGAPHESSSALDALVSLTSAREAHLITPLCNVVMRLGRAALGSHGVALAQWLKAQLAPTLAELEEPLVLGHGGSTSSRESDAYCEAELLVCALDCLSPGEDGPTARVALEGAVFWAGVAL